MRNYVEIFWRSNTYNASKIFLCKYVIINLLYISMLAISSVDNLKTRIFPLWSLLGKWLLLYVMHNEPFII